MKYFVWPLMIVLGLPLLSLGQSVYHDIEAPPHLYKDRIPQDRFSRFKRDLEIGTATASLDSRSEKAFLTSLLKALEIPSTSQMWVFSTTSLQLSLISPSNPRALYFNEDTYVGYIPRGRIEVVSLDPELGGIFYIFDIPRDGQPPRPERSGRCMNCHASEDTGQVPGLIAKSVIPGPGGGSLTAYRIGQSGHGIPLDQRLGGWYVTGLGGITNHLGNLMGRLSPQGLTKIPVTPGSAFDFNNYPVRTSDVLAHLLHEHQVGFVNRVVEASYRARTHLHSNQGKLSDSQQTEMEAQSALLVRYILFADEVMLPPNELHVDSAFKADFLRNRRVNSQGISLKDLDLNTRLMRYRCSYMIYTPLFGGLPMELRERVYRRLSKALASDSADKEFAYLPALEKKAIRCIMLETLPNIPPDLFR